MSGTEEAAAIDDGAQFETLDKHARDKRALDAKSEVIEAIPNRFMRGAVYLFIVVIILLLIIAYIAKVHVIVPVQGRIAPEGENLSVEAQSAGVVTDVFVREGERVEAGDPILELAQVSMGADLTALQSKLALESEKLTALERAIDVTAEVYADPGQVLDQPASAFVDSGPALSFISRLRSAAEDLAKAEADRESETARERRALDNQLAIIEETLREQRNSLAVARDTLAARREMLAIKQQELAQLEDLEERRIVPQSQVVEGRNALISAQGQVNQQRQTIGEARLQIAQLESRMVDLQARYERTIRDLDQAVKKAETDYDQALATIGNSLQEMRDGRQQLRASLVDLQNNLRLKEGEAARLIVTAPRAGEVTDLAFNTPGQSVGRGARVAVVVPEDVRPIVIATLPNKDVSKVEPGVKARIKVDAYPFRQYGTVPAVVERVFPLPDKPEFEVHLALEQRTIRVDGEERTLETGLSVTADLLTKKQRILTLLLKKSN